MRWKTYLSNGHQLGSVRQTPVSEFMAKHSNDLLRLTLFDQRVIYDNVLFPRQAKEVCIAVCTSFAAVNDIQ